MNKILYVVLDASGSMAEMAKISISMNLLYSIREYVEMSSNDMTIKVLKWNETIRMIPLTSNEESELITPKGKSSLLLLMNELVDMQMKNEVLKVLLIGDGNYENTELTKFIEWSKDNKNVCITVVSVGADALYDSLKKISHDNYVYQAEDILSALKALEHICDNDYVKPVSVNDIITQKSRKAKNLDEWS